MGTTRSTLLVVHPGALGDNLLALSALRGLRERFGFSRCVFVGGRPIGRLFQQCGEVDDAVPLEGPLWANWASLQGREDPSASGMLRSVSHAVCWLEDADHTMARMLRRAGIPWIMIRSPRHHGLRSLHQEDRFLEILADWGVQRPAWKPLRLLSSAPRGFRHDPGEEKGDELETTGMPLATQGDKRAVPPWPAIAGAGAKGAVAFENRRSVLRVMIHPGSGSPHKCVGAATWAEVIRHLGREAPPLVEIGLVGGPADEAVLAELRRELAHFPVRVFEHLDLVAVAGLLAQADLFMGHDSGMTHLAAAVGTPTLAVFGPTSPARWAPRGAHVTVVQGAPCRCASWDEVRSCRQKPCLSVDPIRILHRCRELLDSPSCALPAVVQARP